MTDHTNDLSEHIKWELAGAHRYTARAAGVIPTASGDGRIIARLLVRTDDPHARVITIELGPIALAGIIKTAADIERLSANGQIQRVAQQLDVAQQIDDIDGAAPR